MCGIAGYFSNNETPDQRSAVALAMLAVLMEDRGNQSWGMIADGEVTRNVGSITSKFIVPNPLPRIAVLHTRYATTGAIKPSNSHPFTASGKHKIIGVHNGIISNHAALNQTYCRACRVDSQHIFEHLANDIPLADLRGYGTIVYQFDGVWYLGTFNGGELAVSVTPLGLYFASTRSALDAALRIAGLYGDSFEYNLKDDRIYRVDAENSTLQFHMHLSIGYTARKWTDTKVLTDGKLSPRDSYPVGTRLYIDSCLACGDTLLANEHGTLCNKCRAFYGRDAEESESDSKYDYFEDWIIETVTEEKNYICDYCGFTIQAGEQVGLSDSECICSQCMIDYSEDIQLQDESKYLPAQPNPTKESKHGK